jgi:hypothetical protein
MCIKGGQSHEKICEIITLNIRLGRRQFEAIFGTTLAHESGPLGIVL